MPLEELDLQKSSDWEKQLWSFIGKGNGALCPLYRSCQIRSRDGWCPNEYLDELNRMIDDEHCHYTKFNFLKYDTYCSIFLMLEKLAQKYLVTGRVYTPPVPLRLISLFGENNQKLEVRCVPLKSLPRCFVAFA